MKTPGRIRGTSTPPGKHAQAYNNRAAGSRQRDHQQSGGSPRGTRKDRKREYDVLINAAPTRIQALNNLPFNR